MLAKLFAENPYTFAALVALAWVFLIILPLVIYHKTSPINHLKRFPRQDNLKEPIMFKRFTGWYNASTMTHNGILAALCMNAGFSLGTFLADLLK